MLSISLYEKSIPSDKRRWRHLVFNSREDEAKKHKFFWYGTRSSLILLIKGGFEF